MGSFADKRYADLKDFLKKSFLEDFDLKPIPGDAGQRSYYRIFCGSKSYVVMDAPPNYCNVQPFIDIANYLIRHGFSAPEIIKQDIAKGFLVLQDFGSVSIKDYLLREAYNKQFVHQSIYHLILDLLVALQDKEAPSGLKELDNQLLISELSLFVDWYIPYKYGKNLNQDEFKEFKEIWQNILALQAPMPNNIILRDYHVENMMYLEHHESIQKLGLLDFQDALTGSPVYDLVSVLEDARIEVSRKDAIKYVEYFAQKKNMDKEQVMLNYHILGAQRNSRILGVFARKAIRDNDNNYLQYIPRVLKYLEYDLSHSVLGKLKNWLENLE